jgi:hypothetical protein
MTGIDKQKNQGRKEEAGNRYVECWSFLVHLEDTARRSEGSSPRQSPVANVAIQPPIEQAREVSLSQRLLPNSALAISPISLVTRGGNVFDSKDLLLPSTVYLLVKSTLPLLTRPSAFSAEAAGVLLGFRMNFDWRWIFSIQR